MDLKQSEYEILYAIVNQGLADSSRVLSQMTTGGIHLSQPRMLSMPLASVPEICGGPAHVVVAVYLGIKGDISGHVMLMFEIESARRVVDMLLEVAPGTTQDLDELGVSALAETGNVCATSFLNALSDRTGLKILPAPPIVVSDMAGAILQAIVAELYLLGDSAVMVETRFNENTPGHFLLMPDLDSMARLVAALEAIG